MNAGIWLSMGLGLLAGYVLACAQINLRRSKKLLVDAAKIRAAAQEEFERLRVECENYRRAAAELQREADHYRAASRALEETRQRGLS